MRVTRRRSVGLLAAGLSMPFIRRAAAAEPVGKVSQMRGSATRLTEGKLADLTITAPIHQADLVATAAASKLELTFDDGTILTLGESAALKIDDFVYMPGPRFGLNASTISGPFRYLSGKAKGPATMGMVTTPVVTIGIRGTDFWGGPIAGAFGVVLFEGIVSVTTPGGRTRR